MEFVFPLFFVMAGALIAAIVVLGWVSHRRRQEGLQLEAARLGLSYTAEDPFGLLDLPFELLSRGEGRGIDSIVYGTWQGMSIHVADYWYYE